MLHTYIGYIIHIHTLFICKVLKMFPYGSHEFKHTNYICYGAQNNIKKYLNSNTIQHVDYATSARIDDQSIQVTTHLGDRGVHHALVPMATLQQELSHTIYAHPYNNEMPYGHIVNLISSFLCPYSISHSKTYNNFGSIEYVSKVRIY